ncbi:hypothetical protein QTP88_012797 [Uroleucon formosanum]
MDDDQICLFIKNIDDGNTEVDEIGGSDKEGVDEVEYIGHRSDSEQSLDGDYEDNGTYLFSNWSNEPQFIGKDGVHQSSHVNIKDLWAMDGTGIEYFRLSMSMNCFYLLLRAIRFDDITTRAMRQSVDNLAPIRSFFEDFVRRWKQPNGPYHVNNSACSVAERLIRSISGSGRNITCDIWFSSIPLAEDLLNNHNLTMVGILRKNKREIPPIFVQKLKKRLIESSIFGFKKNMTLVSYKPKANKIVLVISTMHNDDNIDTDCARSKPEMIKFYNSPKGEVDTVDQRKESIPSQETASWRWPLTIFFSVLNIAGINSQIIYASNTNAKIVCREYLKHLSKALVYKYMLERVRIKNIPMNIKV